MDRYLWNFHVHHDAPYPAKDSEWELVMQILRPLSAPLVGCIWLYYMGYMPNNVARLLFGALSVGPFMQKLHFLAHARNHGELEGDHAFNTTIRFLQDHYIILSPVVHKRHHEEFDCNFCIVNGWANPLLNRVRIILSLVGVLASEPPTTVSRRERATMKKEAEVSHLAKSTENPQSEADALLADEK